MGQTASVEQLEKLSSNKRRGRLDAIKAASQSYVNEPMRAQVAFQLAEILWAVGLPPTAARVELDPDDQDQQSLLIWYPQVTAAANDYIRPAVKIESGAKSALDPNRQAVIRPYVADDVVGMDLSISNVTTVVAERTFWDKVVILHGLRQWYEKRGALRGGGQRISRHYYDLYRLLESDAGLNAAEDRELAIDCVGHARMFFNSPDLNLASAAPGSFTLSPSPKMAVDLARDYSAMTGMIFGQAPSFDTIRDRIAQFETKVNALE